MGAPPPRSWLRKFPIMMFAIVMGLTGLTIAYEKARFLFRVTRWIQDGLLFASSALFVLFLVLYSAKLIRYREVVKEEFNHPVKVSFFSAVPISLLLLSIAFYNGLSPLVGVVLWYIGVPAQAVLLIVVFSRWIRCDFDILNANPAWFIPIVGTILVPVVGVDVAPRLVSILFFGIGFFFWIVFFSIKLYRIVFHKQMARRFVPTLFIFIAPPAVGLIAHFRITGVLNIFGYELYGIALFFALLFGAMVLHFRMPSFYVSWWAFTFPLDAMAIASMLIYEVTRSAAFMVLSIFFLFVATVVIGFIAWVTAGQVKRGTILEEA